MTELKLLALDAEDLEMISAACQDAVMRVGDMGYMATDQRFAMLVNRFAWELKSDRGRGERHRAALRIDRVERARVAGIDLKAVDGVLELLSITFEPGAEPPSGTLVLTFAGGGTVRLDVECIDVRLRDLGAAWSAKARPEHDLTEQSGR